MQRRCERERTQRESSCVGGEAGSAPPTHTHPVAGRPLDTANTVHHARIVTYEQREKGGEKRVPAASDGDGAGRVESVESYTWPQTGPATTNQANQESKR